MPGQDDDTDGPHAAPPAGRVEEGELLWSPSRERAGSAPISAYLDWLRAHRGLSFATYPELWQWSVTDLAGFWSSLWQYFDVVHSAGFTRVLTRGDGAEGAQWFPSATLNYVDQVLRHPADRTALVAVDEQQAVQELTYGELRSLVASVAAGLRRLGVQPGDRVVAVLPNRVPAVAAFLATASLGAVWASCAPEFGARSMVDRLQQISPTVLLVADQYRYGGKVFDLEDKAASLEQALPGLLATVVVPTDPPEHDPEAAPPVPPAHGRRDGAPRRLTWQELSRPDGPLRPVALPFGHPLWVLFSSGTTGPPKALMHSHGGILLEHLKSLALHCDLGPGSRFFWFSTTGWMMWNFLVGGLLVGATIVCYDGHPMWPDVGQLWRMADRVGVSHFGTSAPFLDACRKDGYSPKAAGIARRIRSVFSTGAPLTPEAGAWAARQVGHDVHVGSVAGGTDVCTAFVGSCSLLPVHAGELQCRMLGADVQAFDEQGRAVVDVVGELVVREPLPSMPIGMYGDDGTRLHESYFSTFPGVWRHGDWVKVTARGSCVVYGRSDATLNRGGVRMGTSEFYRVVESLPAIADSLVVDTSELGRTGQLVLFVVPADPGHAPEELEGLVRRAVRQQISPRHVPDRVVALARIPKTINGKKIEIPVRRILLGARPSEVVAPGALDDPHALELLVEAAVGAAS